MANDQLASLIADARRAYAAEVAHVMTLPARIASVRTIPDRFLKLDKHDRRQPGMYSSVVPLAEVVQAARSLGRRHAKMLGSASRRMGRFVWAENWPLHFLLSADGQRMKLSFRGYAIPC